MRRRVFNISHLCMALIASLLLFGTACGVKSAPQPPLRSAPCPVATVKALPREDHIILLWKVPKPNEKLRQTRAVKFFIYRSELVKGKTKWTEFAKVGELTIEGNEEEISWNDTNLEGEGRYRYQVRAVDSKKRLSAPSPVVETAWTQPPPAPTNLRAEIGNRSVTLIWNAPESDVNITGYNIYRAEGHKFVKINEFLTPTPNYFDAPLENGKKYSYQVRAVTVIGAVQVEGEPSEVVEVIPADTVSPQTPIGVDAFPVEGGVLVRWWRNEEEDLAGYFIYRTHKGKTEKLTEAPILNVEYMDRNVIVGEIYFYQVSAVDKVGNESPKSEPAKVYVKR